MAGASVLFIMVSVISFCLKTHPGFRVETPVIVDSITNSSSAVYQNLSVTTARTTYYGRNGRNGRISTRYSSYAGDGWQDTYGKIMRMGFAAIFFLFGSL